MWLNSTFSQCVSEDLITQDRKAKRRSAILM
jgi:hypothetical protein